MDGRQEWNRRLFESLTSNRLSRNKYFSQFANDWFKAVHKRYRIVASLKKEAGRLGSLDGTVCWISNTGDGPIFHLESAPLQYSSEVALQTHEWDWLAKQEEIRALLQSNPREGLPG